MSPSPNSTISPVEGKGDFRGRDWNTNHCYVSSGETIPIFFLIWLARVSNPVIRSFFNKIWSTNQPCSSFLPAQKV